MSLGDEGGDAASLRTSAYNELTKQLELETNKLKKGVADGKEQLSLVDLPQSHKDAVPPTTSHAQAAVRNAYVQTLRIRLTVGQLLHGEISEVPVPAPGAEAQAPPLAAPAAQVAQIQQVKHECSDDRGGAGPTRLGGMAQPVEPPPAGAASVALRLDDDEEVVALLEADGERDETSEADGAKEGAGAAADDSKDKESRIRRGRFRSKASASDLTARSADKNEAADEAQHEAEGGGGNQPILGALPQIGAACAAASNGDAATASEEARVDGGDSGAAAATAEQEVPAEGPAAQAEAKAADSATADSNAGTRAAEKANEVIDADSAATALASYMQLNKAMLPAVDISLVVLPSAIVTTLDAMLHEPQSEKVVKTHKVTTHKLKALEVIVAGLQQSVTDLKRHSTNSKRAADRNQKKIEGDKEKDEISKSKTAAIANAKQVRDRQEQSMKLSGLFRIKTDKFSLVPAVDTKEQWNQFFIDSSGDRAVKCQVCDEISKFSGTEIIQRVISNFGSGYKKTKQFLETGAHTAPMMPKQGREETDAFMTQFMPVNCVDVTKVLPTFKGACWMYGLQSALPKTEPLPSGAGQLRLQMMGAVTMILADVAHLAKVVAAANPDGRHASLDACTKLLHNLSETQVEECMKQKCHLWFVELKKFEMLWIPAGFVCATRAGDSASLTYGLRKSFFHESHAAKTSLTAMKDAIKVEGKNVSRMEDVINLY